MTFSVITVYNCIDSCFWTLLFIRATNYVGTLGRKLTNQIWVIWVNKKNNGLINAKYIGKMQ